MFKVHRDTIIRARFMAWLPSIQAGTDKHLDYWLRSLSSRWNKLQDLKEVIKGLPLDDFAAMRTASIDLRVPELLYKHGGRVFNAEEGSNWVYASKILTQMELVCKSLEYLYIRIPPQQEFVNMVEKIVANNTSLYSVIIEVDSTNQSDPIFRPAIRFSNFCRPDKTYKTFQRFVIRAPSSSLLVENNVPMQFRLMGAEEFGIAVNSLTAPHGISKWILKILDLCPSLHRCEFSVFQHNLVTRGDVGHPPHLTSIALPNLTDLILEVPEGVPAILRSLQAPLLMYLRVHTGVCIDDWVFCPLGHFPSIFCVNIWCPGQSAARLDALGIPRSKYYHNLDDQHNNSKYHNLEFLAYIKPYIGSRNIPSAPSEVIARVHAGRQLDADAQADVAQARAVLQEDSHLDSPVAQAATTVISNMTRRPWGPGRAFDVDFVDEATGIYGNYDQRVVGFVDPPVLEAVLTVTPEHAPASDVSTSGLSSLSELDEDVPELADGGEDQAVPELEDGGEDQADSQRPLDGSASPHLPWYRLTAALATSVGTPPRQLETGHLQPSSADEDDGIWTDDEGSAINDEGSSTADDGSSSNEGSSCDGEGSSSDEGSFSDEGSSSNEGSFSDEGSLSDEGSSTADDGSSIDDDDDKGRSIGADGEKQDSISDRATDRSDNNASSGRVCMQDHNTHLHLSSDEEDEGQAGNSSDCTDEAGSDSDYTDALLAIANWSSGRESSGLSKEPVAEGRKRVAEDDIHDEPQSKRPAV
ncbi:hypothetical protein OC844_007308, partial [Tilletia horrida]